MMFNSFDILSSLICYFLNHFPNLNLVTDRGTVGMKEVNTVIFFDK